MNKRIALLSVLLLLIPVGFLGLISNEAGSQWLLRQIFSVVPNQLAVTKIEGRLLDHLSLSNLHYQSATETISIDKLAITWQPQQLLLGRLHFVDLMIDGLNISLTNTPKSQQTSDFELNLPLQISIENALVSNLTYQDGEFVQNLQELQFAVATEDGQLKIVSLTIDDPIIKASSQGQIALSKDLNFNATAHWQMYTEQNGVWQGFTTVNGNRNLLSFNQQLSSPFQLTLQGSLDDLKTSPRLAAHADWHNLVWPISSPTPQVKSDQGSIELSGLLSDYQIILNGQLSQHYLPDASLTFTGKGHQMAMTIEKLALSSTTGSFLLSGEVGWQDAVQFDLNASGQNFNPAILHPDMTGSLTFNTHIKGKQADSSMQLDAEIANLTGQLRGAQVNAHGKLALNEDQLRVDRLEVSAGTNRITANGSIGDVQSELQLAINAPALNQIYPTLAGSLKGAGMLKGTMQNPGINLQLQGKRLRFADYSADQLSIDVDYSPNAQQHSNLLFSVNTIKTGSLKIDRAQIEGRGSSANQQYKADIQSSHGNISAAWMGHLQAGNWQADISKLDLFSPDAGLWQIKRPSILTVTQNPQGIDTAWSETCLLQKNASLCSQGRYQANGDFNVSLLASSLPTKLLNPFLPANMSVTGIMNADAELNQQQDLLKGRFQLAIPEAKLSLKDKTLALGASSLAGVINGDSLATTLDMALADQDYIRGQLQSNIGKSQALNGQLKASIRELAMIELVVPKLSAVEGLLTADLQLKGTRANPILMGQLNLNQGSVNLVEQGFGLRDMSVDVLASGDQLNSIELNGSLLPKLLNTANASESIELNGLVNLHANLQQHKGLLAGNYRIDSPPLAISLGSAESATKITVAASAVSGAINGENVSADIDLKLAGQDSIRGQFNLDHTQQTLLGKITASIEEFALLNPLLPQLSNIKGRLNADLAVQGTLKNPHASGELHFNGDSIEVNDLGIKLREIKLNALALGEMDERIQFSGSAKSADGNININGFASLHAQTGWPVELTLLGENFEIAKTPEAQIALSPDLKLTFAHQHANVTGVVKVPKAILLIKEFPENAVKVSADEIIIGEEHQTAETSTVQGIDLDIDLDLGKQVSFSGRGLNTDLAGKLHLTKANEKTSLFGKIDMLKARYKSYGQDLTVRQGRFVFNGPLDDPWIDIEAIRVSKNQKVTAILGLTGSLKKPQTRIYSDPSLPESEALAYLVTGHSLSQVGKAEGNMLAGAAMAYAGGHAAWITDKLGIDEFDVQEGETLQDTLVAMGEYLTPDLYLGTKVGLFNKQAVMVLKHNITDAINLETQTGTSHRIKLNYEVDKD